MPTTTTKSIGTASRDYSTIQAWEDASPANLVSSDEIWSGECYNDAEFGVTTEISISGQTVDATRYVALTAAAGQSFKDHANVRTNALKYDQAKGVGIRKTSNYNSPMKVNTKFTRLSRLQFKYSGANGSFSAALTIGAGTTGHNIKLTDLILDGGTGAILQTDSNGVYAVNVAGICGHATRSLVDGTFESTFIGCTFVRGADVTPAGVGININYATTSLVQSTAIFGCAATTPVTSGKWDTTNSKNNATDSTSGLPGSNNQHSVTFSRTTPLTDANKGTPDLRAIAATALASAGYLDATNAPNDISGTARAASPTIGAWELVAIRARSLVLNQAVNRAATF